MCEDLWDSNVYVDQMISARRPDIIAINKAVLNVILMYVSIPANKNISTKEEEKLYKYQDLKSQAREVMEEKDRDGPCCDRGSWLHF